MSPSTVAKAITAGCTGAAGALATSLADGDLSAGELAFVVLTAAGAAAATWAIPNAAPAGGGAHRAAEDGPGG